MVVFTISPSDLRREVYANFSVTEPLYGTPPVRHFMCICRGCRRILLMIPQVVDENDEMSANALIEGLNHIKTCKWPPGTPAETPTPQIIAPKAEEPPRETDAAPQATSEA